MISELKKVASKIEAADKVVLYSDSDLDGVISALLLKITLSERGKEVVCYFADRDKRGYGLNPESVKMIKSESPALLVVMDCGISNFKGVKLAKEEGFEVAIIDHHKPHNKLPEADVIVCPKIYEEGFKERPNAGIIFLLTELIIGKRRKDFNEYTALTIISDMMIREDENAEILKEAVNNFPATEGVKSFTKFIEEKNSLNYLNKIGPILNVTDIISGIPESFTYFLIKDEKERDLTAQRLIEKHEKRKRDADEIKKEIIKKEAENIIIFSGSKKWPSSLLGKIASRLVAETDKPVFIYKDKGTLSRGTVRVPKGVDAVKAMESSENILESYGGHPPAAGFTIKNKNIKEFRKNLEKYFKK